MVRHYQKVPGHTYGNYLPADLEKALDDVKSNRLSIAKASRQYNVPRSTIQDKLRQTHFKKAGGQPVLSDLEEETLKSYLLVLASYGFPLTTFDLRVIVKTYLCNLNRTEKRFQNNFPGKDWALLYLRRHPDLTQRFSANIKRARAKVTPEVIKSYINNVKETIPPDTPPGNIYNYDETNLTDDPLNKKVIMKRGTKYPERVINSSKSSTSVMFCGNAEGELMPPYTVYKSEHMWKSWVEGGPKDARYNRSKSGWFDALCFEDWFEFIALPILKKKKGKKVLFGDNLSSHFSYRVLKLCEENDVIFVSLPPNSTHLTQPLDVAFFRPLKYEWRKMLLEWKLKHGDKPVSKDVFPRLLKRLVEIMEKRPETLINGFRKCGIYPVDPQPVLNRMPPSAQDAVNLASTVNLDISASVLDFLSEQRYGKENEDEAPRKRKKVQVEPGKGVTLEDITNMPDDTEKKKKKKEASKPKAKPKQKDKQKENASDRVEKTPEDSEDVALMDSDMEDDVASQSDTENSCDIDDKFPVGCFVIVEYEGEKFPGKVINTDIDNTAEVSTMVMRGPDWAWPSNPDNTWYHFDKILEKISEPQLKPCFSQRAHREIYVVPEITKYRARLC